jgi:hypothetical protein
MEWNILWSVKFEKTCKTRLVEQCKKKKKKKKKNQSKVNHKDGR